METQQISIYKLKELSKKAIEKYRHINVEDDWYTFLEDEFKQELKEYGFEMNDMRFSGFWRQGDGLSFTGHFENIFHWIKKVGEEKYYSELLKDKYDGCELRIDITRSNYPNYVHEMMMDVSLYEDVTSFNSYNANEDDELEMQMALKQDARMEELVQKLESDCLKWAREKAVEFYGRLEEQYNHLTSDESVMETIEVNEMEFTEEGEHY